MEELPHQERSEFPWHAGYMPQQAKEKGVIADEKESCYRGEEQQTPVVLTDVGHQAIAR